MKKWLMIGSMAVFLSILCSAGYANDVGVARIGLLEGDVLVLTEDTDNEWVAATINLPLMSGDRMWVPQGGKAEIQFIGRTYLRADENTEVRLKQVRFQKNSRTIQIAVPEGNVYVAYRSLMEQDSLFQVDTPIASVIAYEDARYAVRIRDDGYTEVSVFSGAVHIHSPYGNTRIVRGEMISIGPDQYAEVSPLGPRSDWIRWNQSRDAQLAESRSSSRYLPPELDVYSSDFDQYGRWEYVSDYGYVWTPRVIVRGWAPYRHGRWVWMRGDYVWISYEPWGWAPYHYGRWAFRVGIGWFWVPPVRAVYWSPGFVAWVYTPTYISWVPLAPGEVYYGYGYYGPHSVNLTTVNVRNIQVTNVYVNARVENAVTIVHRETFLTGRPVRVVDAPPNPFIGGRISLGRPDIRPVKETIRPLPEKVVHPRILPPPRVIEKARRSGLDDRPAASRKEISLFREGKPGTSLPVRKLDRPRPVGAPKVELWPKEVHTVPPAKIPERHDIAPREQMRIPAERRDIQRKTEEYPVIERKPVSRPDKGIGRERFIQKESGDVQKIQPMTRERVDMRPKEEPRDVGKVPHYEDKARQQHDRGRMHSVEPRGADKHVPSETKRMDAPIGRQQGEKGRGPSLSPMPGRFSQ